MSALPTAAVVICAYTEKRWDDLLRALRSVRYQTYPPLEVVVAVDHNPALLERARRELHGITVVENPEARGLSGTRNAGVAATRADVVAFLDDDAVAAQDWLERLVAAYEDPAVVGAGGLVEADWPEGRPGWFPEEFDWVVGCSYLGLPRIRSPVRNPIGANMSFRRDVLDLVGGFRAGIGRVGARPVGCEETELSIRACQRLEGARIVHEPRAVVRHRIDSSRTSPRYFASRCFSEGVSKALVAQHVGGRAGLASERRHVARQLTRGVASGLGGGLHANINGLARALAIVTGLAFATAGYALGARSAVRRASVVLLLGLSAAAALGAPAAVADVGFRGPSFGSASAPTAEKPQSKVWFVDGTWWASMYEPGTARFSIHRLDRAAGRWRDTGTSIDGRRRSRADALWDGTNLYVVSAVTPGTSGDVTVRVMRYSYAPATKSWSLDPGFPVTVDSRAVEAAVMAKDSTGVLWVTYTDAAAKNTRSVYVTHSTGADTTWSAPFVLPVPQAVALSSDDISTIVSFGSRVGVMWGSQPDDAYYFATHRDGDPDGDWSVETPLSGPDLADDHISLRAIGGDVDGRVAAAVKTSHHGGGEPLILLLLREPDGDWTGATFGTVTDNHTRPTLSLDAARREAYVLAAAPCCSGGSIYRKKTSLDAPGFLPGLGTPFIQLSSDPTANNPTTSKQPVDGTSGLLALAGDDRTDFYLYNLLDLGGAAPPDTFIDAGPAGTVSSSTATFDFSASRPSTFECSLDGGGFVGCASPAVYSGLADGTHVFEVRASADGQTDPTPASRTWTIDSTAPLFRDGFESGDFSNWTSTRVGGDGTATVQGSVVREGSFAARLSATTATGSFAYTRKTLPATEPALAVSGDFRLLAEGVSGANVPLLRLFDAAGTRLLSLYRQNLDKDRIYLTHSGGRFATTGVLPLSRWSRFEVRVDAKGPGASTVQVLQDGAEIYRSDTASIDPQGIATLQLGNDTAKQAFDLAADGIVADVW
jgi:GT2 family glycosyltransferase